MQKIVLLVQNDRSCHSLIGIYASFNITILVAAGPKLLAAVRGKYDTNGPKELLEIVGAVNDYLQFERDQLSNRAIILSGVSHNLGTPATRLRLRASLIQDDAIRNKLEGDIDLMTAVWAMSN